MHVLAFMALTLILSTPPFCSHCVIGCKISEQLSPKLTFKNHAVVFLTS